MKALLLIITLALLPVSVISQHIVKDKIVVNGLVVGNPYTEQELIKALGTPTKIGLPQVTDGYENAYTYYYGKDRFYLIEGEFYGCELNSPTFVVNGFIRVGDNISKVNLLGGIKKTYKEGDEQFIHWRPSYDGMYGCTYISFYYDKNNIITYICPMINSL